MEVFITDTGLRILKSKKQELSVKSQRLQQLYQSGDRGQMQSMMDDNRSWMPMMLFSYCKVNFENFRNNMISIFGKDTGKRCDMPKR